jgi:hypothetical protein
MFLAMALTRFWTHFSSHVFFWLSHNEQIQVSLVVLCFRLEEAPLLQLLTIERQYKVNKYTVRMSIKNTSRL